MKKIATILSIMLCLNQARAGELYSVTVHVTSAYDQAPITKAKVQLQLNNRKKFTYVGYTDPEGNFQIDGIRQRHIEILVSTPDGSYLKADTLFYFNKYRRDKVFNKELYPSRSTEKHILAMEDSIYGTYSSPINDYSRFKSDYRFDKKDARLSGYTDGATHYIYKHLHYPRSSYEKGERGRVIVHFVVEKNGDVSHIAFSGSISPVIDAEIRRVLRSTPEWEPAKINGVVIRQKCNIAIEFEMND